MIVLKMRQPSYSITTKNIPSPTLARTGTSIPFANPGGGMSWYPYDPLRLGTNRPSPTLPNSAAAADLTTTFIPGGLESTSNLLAVKQEYTQKPEWAVAIQQPPRTFTLI